ncbi:Ppx/GppA phosphatase family protein [Nocardioides sp. Iso805N]|uniref:Ppx/GppA phosphatase family protein n=1 Tax=Nocardioides sp. Iso805N TaxID=1283287 RepID=UPI000376958F|nr:Ppx/GppA phosphatase family protein [Nocardioides sp. Iso805N]
MATVVPRWEWRTFGDDLTDVATAFGRLPVQQIVDSDEVYVLSSAGDGLVKVRDGLMDVKRLEQVGDDGLEQWAPVLKASFPLDATALGRVAEAWGIPAPSVDEAGLTLEALLADVVATHPGLRAVPVHKHRVRRQIDGCLAEVTVVSADGVRTDTIAVESADPAQVLAVLDRHGLAGRPNLNYDVGLKVMDRSSAERFAVIDVGTNSVKLHVAERSPAGEWRTLLDRSDVVRLGDGLQQTGRLSEEAMTRTTAAIARMADDAHEHQVAAIAAVGTAGLRVASNAADFIHAVRASSGVRIEVISGEDEARLAYRAAIAALPGEGTRVVFDTGGGSSQFTFGYGARVDERFSIGLGAVRLTEQFGLDGVVSEETLAQALAAAAADLERLDGRPVPDSVLGMGGAVTNLTAIKHGLVEYDADVVQGSVLDRDEIHRQIELFRSRTAEERRDIVGLQPARAEVILAGACVVRTVLDKLGADSLTVSDRGLRYGVLAERFGALGTA